MCTRELSAALAVAMAVGFLLGGHSAAAQDREWIVVPYLWGADTSLDLLVMDDPVYEGDLDFSDLVDKLDFAFQLHVETRKDRLGLLLDFTYLDTSDGFTSSATPLPGDTRVDTSADLTILEVGGFYRPSGDAYGWDLLLGARAIDVNAELTLTPPAPLTSRQLDGSKSLTDGFAGLRYVGSIGDNWFVTLRGDAGAGGSDLSLNLVALFGYQFGANGQYSVLAGYRHFDLEFEDSNDGVPVEVDMTMSGPQLGFAFRF